MRRRAFRFNGRFAPADTRLATLRRATFYTCPGGPTIQKVTPHPSRLLGTIAFWGPVASSANRTIAGARQSFPGGTWRVTVTTHDLVSRGVTGSDIPGNRGVWTWKFAGTSWSSTQRESVAGAITDTHHGRITLRGPRVCFTDTDEHLALGCYTWSQSGGSLQFRKMTITGNMAETDGPGILRALFVAHPWRRP